MAFSKSLISIIIPCYNQAQYLDECLKSVLDQTYQNWECIIVNDGSPDNTAEIAEQWVKKDERFRYIFKQNGGLSSARNVGIKDASGECILPLDCDDYISNKYLQFAQNHFSDERIKVIYCEAEKFGLHTGKWVLKPFSLRNLAIENIIFCSAFFRKSDWEAVGGYDENLKSGLEDWDFWIGLLKSGGIALKIESICFYYRTKENSMLLNLLNTSDIGAKMFIEKKHLDFFHCQFGSFNQLVQKNQQNENLIDIMINKRKVSRFINQIYSFFESKLLQNK